MMQFNEHVYNWLASQTATAEIADLLSDASSRDPINHAQRCAAVHRMTSGQLRKFALHTLTLLEPHFLKP